MGFHSIARAACTYCRPHSHFVASSWHLGVARGGNAYSMGIGIKVQMNAFEGSFSTLRSLPLAQQAEAVEDGDSKRSLQSEFWSEPGPLEVTSACRQYSPNSKPLHFFFLQCFSLLIPPGHCSSPPQSALIPKAPLPELTASTSCACYLREEHCLSIMPVSPPPSAPMVKASHKSGHILCPK